MDIDNRLKYIINKLESLNYQTVIVGGAIRNHLLNLSVNDFDLASSASLKTIANSFENTSIIYRDKTPWAIKVNHQGFVCEISQFRSEAKYFNRIPQEIIFKQSFKEDVFRRDFTVNAIGYSLSQGYLDYVGGLKDIENKIVRVINDPQLRFEEDPIRMLRAIRLASQQYFTIETSALNIIKKEYKKFLKLDSDHVAIELKKILAGLNFDYVFKEFEQLFKTLSNNQFNNIKLKNRSVLSDEACLYVYLIYLESIKRENTIFNYLSINEKIVKRLNNLDDLILKLLLPITYNDFVIAFIDFGYDEIIYTVNILKRLEVFSKPNNLIFNNIIKNGHLKIEDLDILLTDFNLDIKDVYVVLKTLLKMVVSNQIENNRKSLLIAANQLLNKDKD